MTEREAKETLIKVTAEIERRKRRNRIAAYYPDTGTLRRDLYQQQLAFFRLGSQCSIRCFMAANRVGKTEGAGAYEVSVHLTGRYPTWWEGKRYQSQVRVWVAGESMEAVREIIQRKLMGSAGSIGEGLIPGDTIGTLRYRQNGTGAIDTARIKHVSGGWSEIGFKSYEQGRESFQGTEKDLIWLDEEATEGIRSECIIRLMTTGGHLIETFTPLKGLTPIVMQYMPDGYRDERVVIRGDQGLVMAGWDDAPHLTDAEKKRMLTQCEPHLVEARTKGIPHIGSGAIYPVPETDVFADDFAIPEDWPKVYGLDVGWNRTAAVFLAVDKQADIAYIWSEYYRGQAEPAIHADGIRSRKVTQGVIDPAARGRSQHDGSSLIDSYRSLGLSLTPADNAVESGLYEVWQRLSSGRLKVFRSCQQWRQEYRMYRRDDKGRIVKDNDHLMDATRYAIMSGLRIASTGIPQDDYSPAFVGWMG